MQRQLHKPPWVAAALLGWLLKDEWQTPLGDYEEYFNELVHECGLSRARWWYRRQVLRLLPDRLVAKTYWTLVMLKNYFVLAYRTLLKNKVSSFINLFGLSVAIGCSIMVFAFVYGKLTEDSFHKHAENIFLVQHETVEEEGLQMWGDSPTPLGPAIEAEFPQVVRAVRIADGGGSVQHEGTAFNERIRFVDADFFDMFSFPLKFGSPAALADQGNVVLSERTANRYFGEENPIGQQLTISFGEGVEEAFTVQGVTIDFPENADLQFRMLINYDKQLDLGVESLEDWGEFTAATFVQVTDPTEVDVLARQMDRYVGLQNTANEERVITSFAFDNLLNLTRNSDDVQRTIAGSVPWMAITILSAIAGFLLALSCFNYMNISLSTATRRFKEIGVRKVMGSTKMQLVVQFLAENMLLCFVSLVLGVVFAVGFFVPAFNELAGINLELSFSESLSLWVFLIGLLLSVGLVSGAYPAFYISSFQPVSILRGQQKAGRRRLFTQSFLAFQFALAFITMITSVVFTFNGIDQMQRDWGYDKEHTLVVQLADAEQFTVMHSEALRLPDVLSVSGSHHHVGTSRREVEVEIEAELMETEVFDIGPGYLETLGISLQTGQFFDKDHVGDGSNAVVINETFVQAQGWTEPIGQAVHFDSTTYAVVGVTEDFHFEGFSDEIEPALFRLTDADNFQYLSMRLEEGTGVQTVAALEDTWNRLVPNTRFMYFFQDTVFDSFYEEMGGLTSIFIFTAIMALLISCMGLFGLASQNIANRMKEISIRKVLGASLFHVTQVVNRRYLILLSIAALVATPVSYLMLTALLDEVFAYHIGVGPFSLLVSYALVFLTASLVIVMLVRKLTAANPAEVLRNE